MMNLQVNGKSVLCRKLGRGCYTTAYQDSKHPNRVFLCTEKGDKSKDVLIAARKATKNKHLPYLRDLGVTRHSGIEVRLYETRFYNNVKEVNTVKDKEAAIISSKARYKDVDQIDAIEIPQSVKDAFKAIDKAAKALGHKSLNKDAVQRGDTIIQYDTHEGNWGIDSKGTVILRDPIVVREAYGN